MNDVYEIEVIPFKELYYSEDTSYGIYRVYTLERITEEQVCETMQIRDVQFDSSQTTYDVRDVYTTTLVGETSQLVTGISYKVKVQQVYNSKYNNYQFKLIKLFKSSPYTLEEQFAYLQSIVTENQARILLQAYPTIVQDVIKNPNMIIDYSRTKGIKDVTFQKIKSKIIENYELSDLLIMLKDYGITMSKINKLAAEYSDISVLRKELMENPYVLTKIHGFGFTTVDDIALKINPSLRDSSYRLIAFTRHFFKEIGESEGHTWVTLDTYRDMVRANVPECKQKYLELRDSCIDATAKNEPSFLRIENGRVGLTSSYNREKSIADNLKRISFLSFCREITEKDFQSAINRTNETNGYELTKEQMDAVHSVVNNGLTIITGCAGTGKSSCIKGIVNMFDESRIALTALSAKAVQRMKEVTNISNAMTIHRLLRWRNNENKFEYNESNQLTMYDLIVIDEASMINMNIFDALLKAIAVGTRVVIVFDFAQLPPIGVGNVATDILNSGSFSIHKFTKIHRQAEASGILVDANKVRVGEAPIKSFNPVTNGELQDIHYQFFEEGDNCDTYPAIRNAAIDKYMELINSGVSPDDVVIICPMRKENKINSTGAINDILVDKMIPNGKVYPVGTKRFKNGCKVIQKVNDYERGVFNGEQGTFDYVEKIDKRYDCHVTINDTHCVYGKSELVSLDLAYALTVHSYQGSECKYVIIVLDTSHTMLLDSCLLYTAITRAKKECFIYAQPTAFMRCIENNKAKIRQTYLEEILK